MYMHLFFNEQKAVDDKIEFNAILDELEEELKTNKRVTEHEILYDRYYEITESPVRGITLTPKQDAINKVKKNYGYFTLLSNEIKNPLDALEIGGQCELQASAPAHRDRTARQLAAAVSARDGARR
jgi:hypothetical protein